MFEIWWYLWQANHFIIPSLLSMSAGERSLKIGQYLAKYMEHPVGYMSK